MTHRESYSNMESNSYVKASLPLLIEFPFVSMTANGTQKTLAQM